MFATATAGSPNGLISLPALIGRGLPCELLDLFGELQCCRRSLVRIGGGGPGNDLPDIRVQPGGNYWWVRYHAAHGQDRIIRRQRPVEPLADHGVMQGSAQGEHVAGSRRAAALEQAGVEVPDVYLRSHPGDGNTRREDVAEGQGRQLR